MADQVFWQFNPEVEEGVEWKDGIVLRFYIEIDHGGIAFQTQYYFPWGTSLGVLFAPLCNLYFDPSDVDYVDLAWDHVTQNPPWSICRSPGSIFADIW